MATNGEPPASERVWRQVTASPRAALHHGLSPADLRTLLLDVSRRRASAVTPARLLHQWRQDRYVRPAASDPRALRLFALVTSARDRGSGMTEAAMLTTHLRFWSRALSELLPGRRAAVRFTVFGFPPLGERMRDTVLPALEPLPERVAIGEDAARERARGYYERGAIRIDVAGDAGWQEVGDGGFTDWTARLLSDAKERCFISCAATERLAALRADG